MANTKSSKFEQTVEFNVKGVSDLKELLGLLPQLVQQLSTAAAGTLDTAQGFAALKDAIGQVNAVTAAAGSGVRLNMPRQQQTQLYVPVSDTDRAKKGEGIYAAVKTSPVTPSQRAAEFQSQTDLAVARAQATMRAPTHAALSSLLPAGSVGAQNYSEIMGGLRDPDPMRNVLAQRRVKFVRGYAPEIQAMADPSRQSYIGASNRQLAQKHIAAGRFGTGLEVARQGAELEKIHAKQQAFDLKRDTLETIVDNLFQELEAQQSTNPEFAEMSEALRNMLNNAAVAVTLNDHDGAQRIIGEVKNKLSKQTTRDRTKSNLTRTLIARARSTGARGAAVIQSTSSISSGIKTLRSFLSPGSKGLSSIEGLVTGVRSKDPGQYEPAMERLKLLEKYGPELSAMADPSRQTSVVSKAITKAKSVLERGDIESGLEIVRQGMLDRRTSAGRAAFDSKKQKSYSDIENLKSELSAIGSQVMGTEGMAQGDILELSNSLNDAKVALDLNDLPKAEGILSGVKGKISNLRSSAKATSQQGFAQRGAAIFDTSLRRMGSDIDTLARTTPIAQARLDTFRAELSQLQSMPRGEARTTAQVKLQEQIKRSKITYAAQASTQISFSNIDRLNSEIESLETEITTLENSDPSFTDGPALSAILSTAKADIQANDLTRAERQIRSVRYKLQSHRQKKQGGETIERSKRMGIAQRAGLAKTLAAIESGTESVTGRTGFPDAYANQLKADARSAYAISDPAQRKTAVAAVHATLEGSVLSNKLSASGLRRDTTSSVNRSKITRLSTEIERLVSEGYMSQTTASNLKQTLTHTIGQADANMVNLDLKVVEEAINTAKQLKVSEKGSSGQRMFGVTARSRVAEARQLSERLQSRYTTPFGVAQLAALDAEASKLEGSITSGAREPEIREGMQSLEEQLQATKDSADQTKKLTSEIEKLTQALLKMTGAAPLSLGEARAEVEAGRFGQAGAAIQKIADQAAQTSAQLSTAEAQEKAKLEKLRSERRALSTGEFVSGLRERYGDKAGKFIDLHRKYTEALEDVEKYPEGTDERKIQQLRASAAYEEIRKQEDIQRRQDHEVRSGAQYRLGVTRGIIRAETGIGNALGQVVSQDVRGAAALPIQSLGIGAGFARDYYQNEIIAKGPKAGLVGGFALGIAADVAARVASAAYERGVGVLDRADQEGVGPRTAFESVAAVNPNLIEQGLVDPATGRRLSPYQRSVAGTRFGSDKASYSSALEQALAAGEPTMTLEEASEVARGAEAHDESTWGTTGVGAVAGGILGFLVGGPPGAAVGAALGGSAGAATKLGVNYLNKEDWMEARANELALSGGETMSPAVKAEMARRGVETMAQNLFGAGRGNVTRTQFAQALTIAPLGLSGAFANPDPEGIMSRMDPRMREEVMQRHRAGVEEGRFSDDSKGVMAAVDEVFPQQYRYAGAIGELANKYGYETETLAALESLGTSYGISTQGIRTVPSFFGEGGLGFNQAARNQYMRDAYSAMEGAGPIRPELLERGSFFLTAGNRGGNKHRMAQGYLNSMSAMKGVISEVVGPAKGLPEKLLMAKALSEFGDVERAITAIQNEETGYTVRDKERFALETLGRQAYGMTKLEDYTTQDIDAFAKAAYESDQMEDISDPAAMARARSESMTRKEAEARKEATGLGVERGADEVALLGKAVAVFDEATASFAKAIESFVLGVMSKPETLGE